MEEPEESKGGKTFCLTEHKNHAPEERKRRGRAWHLKGTTSQWGESPKRGMPQRGPEHARSRVWIAKVRNPGGDREGLLQLFPK